MPRDRIPVNKDIMPYSYEIQLGEQVFSLEFNYNSRRDLFSCNLYRDGELICAGERLTYARTLFEDVYVIPTYPPITLVPLDESGTTNKVNWENLDVTVFVTVDDQDDDPEEGDSFDEDTTE